MPKPAPRVRASGREGRASGQIMETSVPQGIPQRKKKSAAAAAGEEQDDEDDPDPVVVVENVAKAVVHGEPPVI